MSRQQHPFDTRTAPRRPSLTDSGVTLVDGTTLTLVGDLIPFGVWVSRPNGDLVYVSDSFLELIGRSLADVKTAGWMDRIHPEDREDARRVWTEHLRSGTPWSAEYRLQAASGTVYHIMSRGVPVRDERGIIRSWAGLNLDISDRKESEIELRKAKNEAEAANKAKDRFLAILSHELRTPLTPLLTAAQLLDQDEAVPAHLQPTVETVRRNTELEARLIDDLLDISRITQGKLSLAPEVVDVHRLTRSVLEMCRREVNLKQIRLDLRLSAERSHVDGDAARIQQILWNLIKNAVKFTPAGGTVGLETYDDGDCLVIEVADTGLGIASDQLPYVFDAFHQAGRTNTSQMGGLGLGLSITKGLVELHGGSISVRSDGPGRGTIFQVALPAVDDVEDPRQTGEWVPVSRPSGAPIRVLLVDDHEDTLTLFSMALRRHGYEVITANNVESALAVAQDQRFDVLVSDIGLPDGSGIDLIRHLSRQRAIRGIALTGFGAEEDVRRSRRAGFSDHLTKPVGVRQLLQAIDRLV